MHRSPLTVSFSFVSDSSFSHFTRKWRTITSDHGMKVKARMKMWTLLKILARRSNAADIRCVSPRGTSVLCASTAKSWSTVQTGAAGLSHRKGVESKMCWSLPLYRHRRSLYRCGQQTRVAQGRTWQIWEIACGTVVDRTLVATCKDSIGWMFSKLDTNSDLYLDQAELSAINLDKYEVCIRPFFNSCDSYRDGKRRLFPKGTDCFSSTEPPCLAELERIQVQEGAKKKPGKNERSAETHSLYYLGKSKLRCEGEVQREIQKKMLYRMYTTGKRMKVGKRKKRGRTEVECKLKEGGSGRRYENECKTHCASQNVRLFLVSDTYIPSCDEDGFYRRLQCDKSRGECWCVDQHGGELMGSRIHGNPDCDEVVTYSGDFGSGLGWEDEEEKEAEENAEEAEEEEGEVGEMSSNQIFPSFAVKDVLAVMFLGVNLVLQGFIFEV
ncbi:Testican-2 [Labeo rohita]|uniref:Testican-2 n=1 Tax=Labeo rohita TaxID=84645 RepID=A0ABQ8M4R1_LABRO|nr:Testican-2 [Labeo rohita]